MKTINDFENRVKCTIEQYDMLKKCDSVLVGLSGGADSVALCCALKSLEIKTYAVHVNHKLRGDESDTDEQFVREFCKMHDIPLEVFTPDIIGGAKNAKMGVEEYARQKRYEIFDECAKKYNAKIATAHNLNDCAETLIFNITRGCSVGGLCSIPAVRDNIIRPLIDIDRCDIESYLLFLGEKYVTDSTNLSDDYTRNKIRHNVIPVLCEINPSFLQSVKRLTQSAKITSSFVSTQVESVISEKSADVIGKKDDAIIFEYIKKNCENILNITPQFSQIQQAAKLIKQGFGSADFHGGKMLVNAGIIEFLKPSEYAENDEIFNEKFSIDGVKTPYFEYSFKVVSKKEYCELIKINNLLLKNALDYDKMGNSLVLRNRISGDEIRLHGRNCSKTLKKLFSESKIALEKRNRLGVLSNDKKDILWVQNFGADEKYAVSKSTENVLLISINKE